MKLRKTLLCGVAATALGLAAALPNSSIVPNLASPAAAAVQASVSIGFGTFYDGLAPHGDWVRIENRHVWVPGRVDADWRPYSVGRWAYTRPYGWTWVSDEPYGWAVYHYGRWGFHHTIGWYWVPDTVWGPAWVTWRASGDYAAWAPMPPQGLVGISYEVNVAAIPARYWVAVPTAQFLAPNIFTVALHVGQPEFYEAVRYTRPIGHVRIVNNIAVNTYINVNFIERETGEEVRVREVREAREPGEARIDDDAIEIFAPAVEEEAGAEPQEVRTEEEVAEERGVDLAAEPADEEADQPIEVAEDASELPEDAVTEEATPVTDEDVAEDGDAETDADVAEDPEAEGEEMPEAAEGAEGEDMPEAAEGAEGEEQTEAAEGEQPEEQPEAAEADQPEAQPEAAEADQPEEQPEAAESAQPEAQPEAVEADQPEEQPEAAESTQPEEQPEAAEADQPEEQPEAAESAQPQPQAPAAAAEPESGSEVEERAIGEPAVPAEEQPAKDEDEDEEEELRAQ